MDHWYRAPGLDRTGEWNILCNLPTVGNEHAYFITLINVSPLRVLQGSLIVKTFLSAAVWTIVSLARVARTTNRGPNSMYWSVLV